MSDDNEEKSDGYILLENMLKDMPVCLPDLSDGFHVDWGDDYEDRVDDSSLFNPNK